MKSSLNSLIEKANRLRQLRKLTKFGRKDVAQMAGVSVFTYNGWENAKFGGIPENRAIRLVDIFQTEGIICSADWIMYGIGEPPKKLLCYQNNQFKEAAASSINQSPEVIEQLRIKAELEFFCNNYNWETLSLTVPDDAMEPYFFQNELVAGIKVSPENFDETLGMNCIVCTKTNKVMLRQIQQSKTKNLFTLLSLNQNSKQQVILHDMELIDIAPAIWLRKKSIFLPKISHKK